MTSIETLGEEIATLSACLDAATHRLLECIRRFDEAQGWHEQGALSCAHWLAWRIGLDPVTAREKVRVARALGALPSIDEAFRSARLSYAKVRAITRVATADNEERLLAMALVATGAQLDRLCRGYGSVAAGETALAREERSVRRRQLPGGMVELKLVLEPDEAELVLRAIDRARDDCAGHTGAAGGAGIAEAAVVPAGPPEVSGDASAEAPWPTVSDGAVRLAESYLAGHPASGTGGERFQVVVHLAQAPLGPDGTWAAALEDGTRVSAESLRRVACDCALVAADGTGGNLNIGRRARSIPPAIRRALTLRDRGCVFPGCTNTRFLHAHHINHWLHGGETSLANTLLLCSTHHRLVHEDGWTITMDEDREPHFYTPEGRALEQVPPRVRTDHGVESLREWTVERNADLGPAINTPLWDGKNPDYGLAVECLAEAG